MPRDDEEISRHLRGLLINAGPVSVRIVDHASPSSESVSSRVDGLHVLSELSCDQPADARGYIAERADERERRA